MHEAHRTIANSNAGIPGKFTDMKLIKGTNR